MDEEFGPVEEAGVDLGERGHVVLGQLDAFPEFGGGVLAFDGFEVEVEGAGCGVGADGGVAGVGEGAGLSVGLWRCQSAGLDVIRVRRIPVAETGHIVFVSAEILLLGGF